MSSARLSIQRIVRFSTGSAKPSLDSTATPTAVRSGASSMRQGTRLATYHVHFEVGNGNAGFVRANGFRTHSPSVSFLAEPPSSSGSYARHSMRTSAIYDALPTTNGNGTDDSRSEKRAAPSCAVVQPIPSRPWMCCGMLGGWRERHRRRLFASVACLRTLNATLTTAPSAIVKQVGVDDGEASSVFLNGKPRIYLRTMQPSCAIRLLPDASDRSVGWMIRRQ